MLRNREAREESRCVLHSFAKANAAQGQISSAQMQVLERPMENFLQRGVEILVVSNLSKKDILDLLDDFRVNTTESFLKVLDKIKRYHESQKLILNTKDFKECQEELTKVNMTDLSTRLDRMYKFIEEIDNKEGGGIRAIYREEYKEENDFFRKIDREILFQLIYRFKVILKSGSNVDRFSSDMFSDMRNILEESITVNKEQELVEDQPARPQLTM